MRKLSYKNKLETVCFFKPIIFFYLCLFCAQCLALAPKTSLNSSLFEAKFVSYNQVVSEYKFDNYSRIKDLLKSSEENQLAVDILKNNKTLRPVFLVISPETGDFNINKSNQDIMTQYGGYEYFQSHRGFLLGDEKAVEDYLEKNPAAKIMIGLTDKIRTRAATNKPGMTHGRQCFLPQKDGTWIGIKGSGFFRDMAEPVYKEKASRYMGLVYSDELEGLTNEIKEAVNKDLCPKYMGQAQINNFSNTRGGFTSFESIKAKDSNHTAHLVFYHTLSPFRFSDLEALKETDPELINTRRQISKAVKARDAQFSGISEEEIFKTNDELFTYVFKRIGAYQALKINHGLGKETLHNQDFTLAGEEADTEELTPRSRMGEAKLFNISNCCYYTLPNMIIEMGLTSLSSVDLWKNVFSGYLSEINRNELEEWKKEFNNNPVGVIQKILITENTSDEFLGNYDVLAFETKKLFDQIYSSRIKSEASLKECSA